MATFNSLLGACILGIGLSAAAYGQNDDSSDANQQREEQLAQHFSQLDSNTDGVLSLAEFQQMRGPGRGPANGAGRPRGERLGQVSPEQREQMRERMQNMTPEQREEMREQMRERRAQNGGQDLD